MGVEPVFSKYHYLSSYPRNKKAFQWKSKNPLADNMGYIANSELSWRAVIKVADISDYSIGRS